MDKTSQKNDVLYEGTVDRGAKIRCHPVCGPKLMGESMGCLV